jgi:hypothetical protein
VQLEVDPAKATPGADRVALRRDGSRDDRDARAAPDPGRLVSATRSNDTNRSRVLAGFSALGVVWGAWGAALPGVQRRAGISDGELGIALLLVGLGALASMRATGHLMDRRGAGVTAWAVGALGVCGVLPGLASSFTELSLSLFVVGTASGATDVAINAEGVWAEGASGRPLLNLAHASFSGAVVVASMSVGGLRALGGSSALALDAAGAVVASIAIALGISARTGRRRGTAPARSDRPASRREGWGARPPRWLVLLGAMTALAYWVENAWQSWSAVHLAGELSAGPGVSALGPAAFAGAAAIGRLSGQRLIDVLGDRTLITAGAIVAAVGTALAAAAPTVARSASPESSSPGPARRSAHRRSSASRVPPRRLSDAARRSRSSRRSRTSGSSSDLPASARSPRSRRCARASPP